MTRVAYTRVRAARNIAATLRAGGSVVLGMWLVNDRIEASIRGRGPIWLPDQIWSATDESGTRSACQEGPGIVSIQS
jgi:hypothetical protein